MSQLIRLVGETPVKTTYSEFKKQHPHTSFPKTPTPALLEPYGVFVYVDERPEFDPQHQYLAKGDIVYELGQWVQKWAVQDIPPTEVRIKVERDRRLALDFEFQGVMYQRDPESIARISGAGTLALGAMVSGAQVGDLFWHGRETPFAWIASDDTLVTMDAQTCFAFGQAAAARETEIVFAAKALREMDPIPTDFTDDKYWP